MGAAMVLCASLTGPALAQSSPDESSSLSPAGAVDRLAAQHQACNRLASQPWPLSAMARRALLQQLEAARPQCVTHPGFLASLGGLWLEEGEPSQALIWLERALLLDPGHLGAQADLALALAAMGQPVAVESLIREWRHRTDVPLPLRQRLLASKGYSPAEGLGAARLGREQAHDGRWVRVIEATLLTGYESNLDHSPKLTELTLTHPSGPIEQPLETPLVPRKGIATTADLSWQMAQSPVAGRIWRLGVNVGARSAPGEHKTDWHHLQVAASGSQQWGPWRAQVELGSTWIGGSLNEPYRLLRTSLTGERNALGCRLRVAAEAESRTQQTTFIADGNAYSLLWSSQCPLNGSNHWVAGVAVRASVDFPDHAERVGGIQRLWSLGAKLAGNLAGQDRLDVNLRVSRIRDDTGYSVYLEDNARRQMLQTQLSLEWARPIALKGWASAEALVQLQAMRQRSNLALFRFDVVTAYGGLRWAW